MKTTTFAPWAGALLCGAAAMSSATTFTAGDASELATAFGSAAAGDTVTLTADVDMTGWTTAANFAGTLDGQGHKITGLTVPLFGDVTNDMAIQNLVVESADLSVAGSSTGAGVLVNSFAGANVLAENITFTGCSLKNTAKNGNVGFIAGKVTATASATFQNCDVDDTCSFTVSVGLHGSVVGSATVSGAGSSLVFSNCTMAASVIYTQYGVQFGGIVGSATANGAGGSAGQFAHLLFADCTNRSSAVSSGTNCGFGGIAYSASSGNSATMGDCAVLRCANYGSYTMKSQVTTTTNIGGILGAWSNGALTMEDCVNFGDISSTSSSDTRVPIAGIVSSIAAPIKVPIIIRGCANEGDMSGWYTGGIVATLSHNASYKSTTIQILACMNRGALASRKDGYVPGQAIGYLSSGVAYPSISILGCAFPGDALVGNYAEGASINEYSTADTIDTSTSEGAVNGIDLAALNAANDACDLWKQGSVAPILKILPDEAAPDTITVAFVDWDGTVLKTVVIARGGSVSTLPDDPERTDYTFTGWSPADLTGLQSDTTVTAQYVGGVLEYNVTFVDWDGTPIGISQVISYGEAATAPADPVREGYVFAGWDTDFSAIFAETEVRATYVSALQEVATAEALSAALTEETLPGVTVRLTADITLPADWVPVDYYAGLDGNGHTIAVSGATPIFNKLCGTAGGFILAGADSSVTNTIGNDKTFGFVANMVSGGLLHDIALRDLVLQTGTGCYVGLIAGELNNGGAMERCSTDVSCMLRQTRSSGAGGLVGRFNRLEGYVTEDAEGAILTGTDIATLIDCTNAAPIVTYLSNPGQIGGLVGADNIFNSTYQYNAHIVRCANLADITSEVDTGASGLRIGGIVGERNSNNSGRGGTLYIVDSANFGDIPSPGTTNACLGGIVGYFWRGDATVLDRCVNRGDIGSALAGDGVTPITHNIAGGLFGYVSELYNENYISATNSANYGAVTAGLYAGGLAGCANANGGHGYTSLMFHNCANYGTVSAPTAYGQTGQLFAVFGAKVNDGSGRRYGAVNCFFMADDLIADTSGSTMILEGNLTAEDEGYKAAVAKRMLNAAVAESEGQFCTWEVGRIGPELLPFWDGYSPETLILFR